MSNEFIAGAAVTDVTPRNSRFLFGYPHVERYSTGVHDPLLSSALYVSDGKTEALFSANDLIFIPKDLSLRVRSRIQEATGVPAAHMTVSATHTHSGPVTVDYVSNQADPLVPKADPGYLRFLENTILETAIEAVAAARPATAGLGIADGTGIGTNRRDPCGPADLEVPVLLLRSRTGDPIAAMIVCCMHPTVLHEDSTLISADLPGMARKYLREHLLGDNCPILFHTGPEGNQSPRHVTRENTFEEAERLGAILGRAIARTIPNIACDHHIALAADRRFVELPPREFPSLKEAEKRLDQARRKLAALQKTGAPHTDVRTAECDWFGAEETRTLAEAAQSGRLEQVRRSVMPAEIQLIRVGKWHFVSWPGEMFVEYGLAVRKACPNSFVIALANGELQGYIVTPEAAAEGGYEASNALFAPRGGDLLTTASTEMVTAASPPGCDPCAAEG